MEEKISINIKEQTNQALQFHQSGQFIEADNLYASILEAEPNNASVLNLYGLLKHQQNQFKDADFYIKKAIEINPCAYFYEGLGRVYADSSNYNEAINIYQKALNLEPQNFYVWFNLALAYKNNGQLNESINAYENALIINPNSFDVYFNLGSLYESKNDTLSAINCYKKASEYNPNDIENNYFLAVSYLKVKNFKEGWRHFETRPSKILSVSTQRNLYPNLITSKPLWQGEDIKDKTLYVYYEAGLGDTIMFERYLPLLKNICAKVIFAPQSSLVSFFKDNFADIEILDSKVPES